jgi:hypothetical protein
MSGADLLREATADGASPHDGGLRGLTFAAISVDPGRRRDCVEKSVKTTIGSEK